MATAGKKRRKMRRGRGKVESQEASPGSRHVAPMHDKAGESIASSREIRGDPSMLCMQKVLLLGWVFAISIEIDRERAVSCGCLSYLKVADINHKVKSSALCLYFA